MKRRPVAVLVGGVAALPLLAGWTWISDRFSGDDLNFAAGAGALLCLAAGIAVWIIVYGRIVQRQAGREYPATED